MFMEIKHRFSEARFVNREEAVSHPNNYYLE